MKYKWKGIERLPVYYYLKLVTFEREISGRAVDKGLECIT